MQVIIINMPKSISKAIRFNSEFDQVLLTVFFQVNETKAITETEGIMKVEFIDNTNVLGNFNHSRKYLSKIKQ